ncbi:hypothetical protein OF846_001925 [Rhodotorula toruloides]|nr:hypothetical protein OF846_001925 [Rhodotorula toruloides]
MDTQTMGECLVCGTETKNRCSACAKAGVDLFFCSPEHQKLAWHMHRMFCGPGKANPFRWPPLTPKEAEAATRILDLPINTVMPHSATLFQELQVVVHCPRSEMPRILQELSQPSHLQTYPPALHGNLLRIVRVHLSVHSQQPATTEGIEFLTLLGDASHLDEFESDPPPWLTGYLHRLSDKPANAVHAMKYLTGATNRLSSRGTAHPWKRER